MAAQRFSPLGACRLAAGYTQESFAEQLGVDRSTVGRWERGTQSPQPWQRPDLAAALDIDLEELDDLLRRTNQRHAAAIKDTAGSGFGSLAWRVTGEGTVPGDDHCYSQAVQSFRAADQQVGGGHLYATIVKYLQTVIAPRLFGVDPGSGGQLVITAAAALTEMAGWMAYDAGCDQAAEQHFIRSLDLVRIGGDRQLGVHVLASMSHLAHHRGRPADAIALARRGRDVLARGRQQPELAALLLAMQARGFAVLGRTDDCTQRLIEAERALSVAPIEPRSPWVSRFDEGSLASEAARCLRQFGDLTQAQRQAERILQLRPAERTRSRAFGQLMLAAVLIAQGNPDQACAVAQQVLDATRQLGSYPVILQLLDLKQLLEPYRANGVVAGFLGCLDQALRERAWLQWLTPEQPGQAPGFGASQ